MAVEDDVEGPFAGEFRKFPFDGLDFHHGAVVGPSEVDLLIHADRVGAREAVRHAVGVGEGQDVGVELLPERTCLGRVAGQRFDQAVDQIGAGRLGRMDPAVDPNAGFLFSGDRGVGDVQQLQRAAFVAEADGVECHVGPGAPGLEPFLMIAVGIGRVQGDVNRVAGKPLVEAAALRFRQREMVPDFPVVGIGSPGHAVVFLGEIDLFALDARHPEIVPVRAGLQRRVDGVVGIVFSVDQEGQVFDRVARGDDEARRIEQLGASEGAAFEIAVKPHLR